MDLRPNDEHSTVDETLLSRALCAEQNATVQQKTMRGGFGGL